MDPASNFNWCPTCMDQRPDRLYLRQYCSGQCRRTYYLSSISTTHHSTFRENSALPSPSIDLQRETIPPREPGFRTSFTSRSPSPQIQSRKGSRLKSRSRLACQSMEVFRADFIAHEKSGHHGKVEESLSFKSRELEKAHLPLVKTAEYGRPARLPLYIEDTVITYTLLAIWEELEQADAQITADSQHALAILRVTFATRFASKLDYSAMLLNNYPQDLEFLSTIREKSSLRSEDYEHVRTSYMMSELNSRFRIELLVQSRSTDDYKYLTEVIDFAEAAITHEIKTYPDTGPFQTLLDPESKADPMSLHRLVMETYRNFFDSHELYMWLFTRAKANSSKVFDMMISKASARNAMQEQGEAQI